MRRCIPLLLLFLLLTAWPVWAASMPLPSSNAPLQAEAETYDFGSRSILDLSPISHTFVLRAGPKSAVIVDRLQPSCRCTQAIPRNGVEDSGRFTIPAGQDTRIDVTVNPGDMVPGGVAKEVYVFINGESTPALTLHVRGVITPAVAFSPSVLDFGSVAAGTAHAMSLRVALDPRLLAPGQTARLVCSNPGFRVVRQEEASSSPQRLTYQVVLPPGVGVGKITGTLSLTFSPGGAESADWSVPVRGQVTVPSARR